MLQRELARNSSHERTLETLPFLVAVVGMVVVLAAVALFGWMHYWGRRAPDLLALLHQQDRRLLDLERATYHQIALEQRRRLPVIDVVEGDR